MYVLSDYSYIIKTKINVQDRSIVSSLGIIMWKVCYPTLEYSISRAFVRTYAASAGV